MSSVEYNLRTLPTTSITLFPARAQISREVGDVPLQPGTNEVTIIGLSPTTDEHSIKVEGSGEATISNITVERLANTEQFDDVYPDEDEDILSGSDDVDTDDNDDDEDLKEDEELRAAKAERQQIMDSKELTSHRISCLQHNNGALDGYITNVRAEHNTNVEEASEAYQRLRQNNYRGLLAAQADQRHQDELLKRMDAKIRRLTKRHRKQTAQARRQKRLSKLNRVKEQLKASRAEEQRIKEKRRIRTERSKFWPKYVYAVRIQLEVSASLPSHGQTCSLLLSYVTSDAYWAPSYDLQLSTKSATGTLCFDALLTNATSETWDKCKITLSTSQATSSSLADKAPELREWAIKRGGSGVPLLYSREEHQKRTMGASMTKQGKANREAMFGFAANDPRATQDYQMQLMLLEQQNKKRMELARQKQNPGAQGAFPAPPQMQQQSLFGGMQSMQQQAAPTGSGLFGARRSALSQAQEQQAQAQAQQAQAQDLTQHTFDADQFDRTTRARGGMRSYQRALRAEVDEEEEEGYSVSSGDETPREDPNLAFQNSLIEQTGFATVYELQGPKTLAPSSTSAKQRISTIDLSAIKFTHTVVPKLKAAAYLTATIANTSRNILLQGPVGVTLDGGFMGRTTLPRCPGDGAELRLGLGVDHAVRVVYATPEVRRSGGVSYNEERKIYMRSVYVENTHSADSIRLVVKDQVPVSKDERVRVEVLHPDKLRAEHQEDDGKQQQKQEEVAEVGEAGRKADEGQWGRAEVKMLKTGAVDWLVTLRKGRSVRLALSWLVATPLGEEAMQVDH
ncbi:uncharacterized protein J7T54_008551 [Emericellopsis cladophorae]|uniref:Mucoidy inhibitor-like protein n=1 Tax=Emericellopsis cladophorae TaxID=2686198 RepID=A0A9P9XU98_9HYPO|nr:uncharacterized protein J7T54_008551 [Emericellopsis cladophorae]KAI6777901.1 hypothetical protein J7T54_008551 [Emericellopsis cladophorae]